MVSSRETQLSVDLAISSHAAMPFTRVDFAQVCQFDDVFGLTFHQLDYQAAAEASAAHGGIVRKEHVRTIIVGRTAFNLEGVRRLHAALTEILAKTNPTP